MKENAFDITFTACLIVLSVAIFSMAMGFQFLVSLGITGTIIATCLFIRSLFN